MKKLIFLHIPKSAGSTIQVIFKRQYKKRSFFIPGAAPDLDVVKKMLTSESEIDLCFGHMDYGVHEAVNQDCKYATIIRNPIERVISQYYYVKRQPKHHLYNQAFKENDLSLAEYVEKGLSTELNNGQVRILTGAGGFHKGLHSKYDIPFGECERWMLEEAKMNIEKDFVFCGIQDFFDESLVLMKKRLGWYWNVGYVSQNITHRRKKASDLDDRTLQIIKDANALDIELYDWFKAKFLAELEKEESYLKKGLRKLKWAKLYEHYKRLLKNILIRIFKILR